MQKHVIGHCPICENPLVVTTLSCQRCATEIKGEFLLSKFNYLSKENLYFIEIFVKNKGSIKGVEKELKISYPTVKKQLDEIILGLGYTPDAELTEPSRRADALDLLEKLARKEISKEDVLKQLGESDE